jgi:hypothetical protein
VVDDEFVMVVFVITVIITGESLHVAGITSRFLSVCFQLALVTLSWMQPVTEQTI